MENQTNAQANVQIDVQFGRRGIRGALNKSLDTAEVVWMSDNKEVIEKGVYLVSLSLHRPRDRSFDNQPKFYHCENKEYSGYLSLKFIVSSFFVITYSY